MLSLKPMTPRVDSLSRQVQAYRTGSLSPVAVLEALLSAIQSDTADINAFCWLDTDRALRQASESEARYRAGRPLGPLDGVPVSVKDLVAVQGWPTRRGSNTSADDPVAAIDAPSVALMRQAGCVVFGKTTTTEFGWTIGSSNPHSGVTRNPRSTKHSAGGSSSGAAAQIAAGWGHVALGSDAGGSVRIPASWCGVVGFKPTFGAIPLAPQSAFAEFAHLGLLAASVADCAWAFPALSGTHRLDPSSLYGRSQSTLPGPCLRIGWADQMDVNDTVDPEIHTAFRALVHRLEAAGYAVQPVTLCADGLADAMWQTWVSRIHESFIDWPPAQRSRLEPRLQGVFGLGAKQCAEEQVRSRSFLRQYATRLAMAFNDIDVLLTPATSRVAPRLDARVPETPQAENWFSANSFAFPFNLTQQPALSMPLGVNEQGLPFGVQVVGRRYADDLVLRFAAELEAFFLQ